MYLSYAKEFAAHPLDPYGFQYGCPAAGPANHLLVPPVVPYWLGLGIKLFGDNPIVLKWWMWPFAFILAWAVDFLASLFSPTLRCPIVWLAVLSPTVLPGFNLMLDVPAAAIGLAAVAVAVGATQRESLMLAIAAGVLAALAVQTKYTGATFAAAAVVWCLLRGRFLLGIVVAIVAAAGVVGWESFIAHTQGESHFLVSFRQRQADPLTRAINLVSPLVSHFAGLASIVALFALAGLRVWRSVVRIGALLVAVSVVVLAVLPSQEPLFPAANGWTQLTTSNLVYGVLAVSVWLALGGVCIRLVCNRTLSPADHVLNLFLLAWLVLELGGYFALTPFPAARRLTGLMLVFTLTAGRVAFLGGLDRRSAARFAIGGVSFALLIFVADWFDARAHNEVARRAAHAGFSPSPGGTYWHACWWGVGYSAEREGLRPLQVNVAMPRPGDLLALQDNQELRGFVANHPTLRVEQLAIVEAGDDGFPLRATIGYYDGRTPLEHRTGARMRIFVYRVLPAQPR